MPVVPRYERQQRSVGLPTPNVPEGSTAGIQALAGLSKQAEEMAFKAKERADVAQVMEVESKLAEAENQLLYDPDSGALNQLGKNAFDLPNSVTQDFENQYQQLRSQLANDQQRQAFDRVYRNRSKQVDRVTQRHVGDQIRKYETEQIGSAIKNAAQVGANNYTDGEIVGDELRKVMTYVQMTGEQQGWSPEKIRERRQLATSGYGRLVVETALNGKDNDLANEYFDRFKEDMTADDRAAMQKKLDVSNQLQTVQSETDRIISTYDDETQAIAAARDITDPEIRSEVRDGVVIRFAEQRRLQKLQETEAQEEASEVIARGGSLDTMQPDLLSKLDPETRTALRKEEQRRANGHAEVTNTNAWYMLVKSATGSPNEFSRMNLGKFRDQLTQSDFKTLAQAQRNILNDDSNRDSQLEGIRSQQDIVDQAIGAQGLDPGVDVFSDSDEAKQVRSIRSEIDKMLVEYQRVNDGKMPGSVEFERMVMDQVTDRVFDDPDGFFTDTREISPIEVLSEVPERDRIQIEQALRSRGRVPTPANIVNLYQLRQQEQQDE